MQRSTDINREKDQNIEKVLTAYEKKGEEQWLGDDPRDQYSYMYSKMLSDYTLMEKVGVDDKEILNIGCAFPVDEMHFARKIKKWTSVDISPNVLKGADEILKKELHPTMAKKFEFKFGDATQLPFMDNSYDVSVSMSTFDHLPNEQAREAAFSEITRVTKHGGYVILTVPNWWNLIYYWGIVKMRRDDTLPYGFVYLFSPIELRKMGQKNGLKPVHFASSFAPPSVWLAGYPALIRYPAKVVFALMRLAGYFGRRVGYAFLKP